MKAAGVAEVGLPDILEKGFGKAMAASKAARHTKDVLGVLADLRQQFPELPADTVKKFLLVTPKGNALGRATIRDGARPARMAIRSKEYHEEKAEAWKRAADARAAAGKIRWTVDTSFEGTIRHEVGHTLTRPEHLTQLAKTPYGPSWARKHLSEYGGSNDHETLAEAFCEYTKPGYVKGTLPGLLEAILDGMVKA
jgi:hypothetical protein